MNVENVLVRILGTVVLDCTGSVTPWELDNYTKAMCRLKAATSSSKNG